ALEHAPPSFEPLKQTLRVACVSGNLNSRTERSTHVPSVPSSRGHPESPSHARPLCEPSWQSPRIVIPDTEGGTHGAVPPPESCSLQALTRVLTLHPVDAVGSSTAFRCPPSSGVKTSVTT